MKHKPIIINIRLERLGAYENDIGNILSICTAPIGATFSERSLRKSIDSHTSNIVQNHFNKSGSPFSLREKVRMRGIKSNTCVDYSDPLTPTLSLWERETMCPVCSVKDHTGLYPRRCLFRRDRELGEVPRISNMFG
ncbi:MAG: hypothetical protein ACREU9_09555 [Gammaproteobacteria bacterium]